MARQKEDHSFTRPRMLYGDYSPTVDTTDRDSNHRQQTTEGSAVSGPTHSKATLVRSYSRKLQRSSETQLMVETLPGHQSVITDAFASFIHVTDSTVGERSDGSLGKRQLNSSVRGRHLSDVIWDRNLEGSVKDKQLDRTFSESGVERDIGNVIVADQPVSESLEGIQPDNSFTDRKTNEPIVDRNSDDSVVNRTFAERAESRKIYSSVMGRNDYSAMSRNDYSALDRNGYSAMGRKLSGSVVNVQIDRRSPAIRKPSETKMGRKSAASHVGGTFVESGVNRKIAESVIGRRSSRYSVKLTAVDHRRKSVTTKAESQNQTSKSRKSRLVNCLLSRLDDISRSTSCYNMDFVDENLLISAAKLDSTLIRLFSHVRENHGDTTDEQDPGTALMPFLNYSQSDLISMDAVMWRVFPMDAAQRETLDQELPYIEENLTPSNVMKHLYDRSILTHMDFNQLTRTEGQGEKAVTRLMVKTLQRRGDKAYPAFLEALLSSSYVDICDRLAETERCLRDAMAADRSDSGNRSKIDHVSMHQYVHGKTSQLRNLRIAEVRENSAPLTSMSSANLVSRLGNDTRIVSHTPDQASEGGTFNVKQENTSNENPACELQIVDPKQLERQLLELMEEFESLQKEVIAMKSAPSPQGSVDTSCNSDEVGPILQEGHFATQELSSSGRESIISNCPQSYNDDAPVPSSHKGAQKSTSCIVL